MNYKFKDHIYFSMLALIGGALFGIANSTDVIPVIALALSLFLFGLAIKLSGRFAVLYGFLWGLTGYLIACRWSLYLGTEAWIALSVYHALLPLGIGWLFGALRLRGSQTPAILVTSSLFTAGEYLRGSGWWGVSMPTIGGCLASLDVVLPWASLVGAVGLTLLFCLGVFSIVFAQFSEDSQGIVGKLTAVIILSFFAVGLLLGNRNPKPGTPAAVCLLQGVTSDGFDNLQPPEKMLSAYISLMEQAARQSFCPVAIWPETSYIDGLTSVDSRQKISDACRKLGVAAVTGSLRRENRASNTANVNVAEVFSPAGEFVGCYEKERPVPFGEFLPFRGILGWTTRLGVPETDYHIGTQTSPVRLGDFKLGFLICSEAMFPDLANRRVKDGANLLVVMTNDGWFTRGPGVLQLQRQSVLRAVETGRWVARASETGPSMLISPRGTVVKQTKLYDVTWLSGSVELISRQTLYTRSFLFWPFFLIVLSVLSLALALKSLRNQEK